MVFVFLFIQLVRSTLFQIEEIFLQSGNLLPSLPFFDNLDCFKPIFLYIFGYQRPFEISSEKNPAKIITAVAVNAIGVCTDPPLKVPNFIIVRQRMKTDDRWSGLVVKFVYVVTSYGFEFKLMNHS